jgi:hypothetical protein
MFFTRYTAVVNGTGKDLDVNRLIELDLDKFIRFILIAIVHKESNHKAGWLTVVILQVKTRKV